MTFVSISIHANKRCRERVGIPRRGVRRLVLKAWERGFDIRKTNSDIRQHVSNAGAYVAKRYANHVFVFGLDFDDPHLVTVLDCKVLDEDRSGLIADKEFRARRAARRRGRRYEGANA